MARVSALSAMFRLRQAKRYKRGLRKTFLSFLHVSVRPSEALASTHSTSGNVMSFWLTERGVFRDAHENECFYSSLESASASIWVVDESAASYSCTSRNPSVRVCYYVALTVWSNHDAYIFLLYRIPYIGLCSRRNCLEYRCDLCF